MILHSKKVIITIILVVFTFGAVHMDSQTLTPPASISAKILISGEATIIKGGSGSPVISPYFNITRLSNPVRGLMVTVEGIKLRETMPGQYAGVRITHVSPVVGSTLRFTIESKKFPVVVGSIEKGLKIEGEATIGSMARITKPASESVIILERKTKFLPVEWRDGIPAFTLSLLKNNPGSPLEIYNKTNILGRTHALKSTLFEIGQNYSIGISYNMTGFTIKNSVKTSKVLIDKASKVKLRCAVFSNFKVSKSSPVRPIFK